LKTLSRHLGRKRCSPYIQTPDVFVCIFAGDPSTLTVTMEDFLAPIARFLTAGDHDRTLEAVEAMVAVWPGPMRYIDDWMWRNEFVKHVGWSVPCHAAIQAIISISKNRTMLSIGTGLGCWEFLLSCYDVHIVASDVEVPVFKFFKGTYDTMDASEAVQTHPEADVLFINWPRDFATAAVSRFKGTYVVSVGEINGCTGNVGLELEESEAWELETHVEIPCWSGFHDDLRIYKRVVGQPSM